MKTLSCRAVRRRLQAFHDGELSVPEQISVAAHIDACRTCAAASLDLAEIGAKLQREAFGRFALSYEDAAGFTDAVISRLEAEEQESFGAQLRRMFDDLHLVYAAGGSAMASLACVVVLLSLLRFGAGDRPDSLSAMVAFLATPGIAAGQSAVDADVQTRWNERFRQANEAAEQDAVFTLSAVVTHGSRRGTLDHLRQVQRRSPDDAKLIEGLMDSVLRGRLGTDGEGWRPASNMFRLVTQTTVKAAKNQATEPTLPPAPKKRAAIQVGRPRLPSAV